MLEHEKVRPTKGTTTLQIVIPKEARAAVVKAIKKMGVTWTVIKTDPDRGSIPAREAEGLAEEIVPGRVLAGLRYREGLTQAQLAAKTGIPQHRISELEHGVRGISKNAAKILGKALNADYRLML